jgi:hypothetical protein
LSSVSTLSKFKAGGSKESLSNNAKIEWDLYANDEDLNELLPENTRIARKEAAP